jgi:hypothetical protein
MIEFLVYLLVLCLVFGLIYYALGLLPLPPPFKNIVLIILLKESRMGTTCVWAFRRIPELNNATGFVECEEELAERLISEGRAQDPRIGATPLNYIEDAPPEPPATPKQAVQQVYDDKAMTPRRSQRDR